MKKYMIERTLPGAGKLAASDLQAVASKSNGVLCELGPSLQWVHSHVTGDKIYCVYLARDVDDLHEHARRGGFPIDAVHEIVATIDPTTAETR